MTDRTRSILALLLTFVLAVAAVAATGCTQAAPPTGGSTGPTKGGSINYYLGEPAFIDPIQGDESEGVQVISAVFDGLVDFDPLTSKIMPAAAETWSPNADATVWTFKLRQGAKFSNGEPVTAASFKWAWERIADPKNKSDVSYHLAPIKGTDDAGNATGGIPGIVAKDDNTLEVTLKYPFADFEYVAGHPTLAPVPKSLTDTPDKAKAFLDMPVGNGPFKLSEPWKHQQFIKVVRNDDYYGTKPGLDGVNFQIFKDDETAFNEFKAGNLDFAVMPNGQIKSTVAQYGESPDGYTINPGKQCLLGPELSTYFVWLNCKDQYLSDVHLRRAISLAINREAIAQTVYEGTRLPASGPVPSGVVGYQPDAWEFSKYDVAAATKELAQSKWPAGTGLPELALSFNAGRGHEKVMQLIQADLAKIGIKVKLDGRPWETYTSDWLKVVNGEYATKGVHQLSRLGWQADYPIFYNFLYPLFSSTSADNKALYVNKDVDAKILEAAKVTNAEERVKKFQEVEKMIGPDVPLVPIVNYRHVRVGSDRVNDLIFSPMGIPDFTKTWVKGGAAAPSAPATTAPGSTTATP